MINVVWPLFVYSWKCFRGQKQIDKHAMLESSKTDSSKSSMKASDWLSNADDWGSDDDNSNGEIEVYMDQNDDEIIDNDTKLQGETHGAANRTEILSTDFCKDKSKETIFRRFAQMGVSEKITSTLPKTIDIKQSNENQDINSSSSNSSCCLSPTEFNQDAIGRDSNANTTPTPVSSGKFKW